jgi:hypothetical protein
MADLADDWNVNVVTSAIVFQALANRTGMSAEDVEAHARDCCRQIEFHPLGMAVHTEAVPATSARSVNPDLLLDYVVPLHGLTAVFDVIIVSASEHCADKVELCDAALSRLGLPATGRRHC